MPIYMLPDSSVFNLEGLYTVAFDGISKAYLFTGFTANATKNTLLDYKIRDLNPNIEILKQPLSPELHKGLQNEFGHWVVWHALAQMMESFQRFTNAIFRLLIDTQRMSGAIGRKRAKLLLNEFSSSLSFEKKIARLTKLNIKIYHKAELISLMGARNRFIHHYALAQEPYQDIRWIAPWFAYKDKSGELHELVVGMVFADVEEWLTIEKSYVKRFIGGQVMTLEMIELHWICFMMLSEVEGMLKSLETRLEAFGCKRVDVPRSCT